MSTNASILNTPSSGEPTNLLATAATPTSTSRTPNPIQPGTPNPEMQGFLQIFQQQMQQTMQVIADNQLQTIRMVKDIVDEKLNASATGVPEDVAITTAKIDSPAIPPVPIPNPPEIDLKCSWCGKHFHPHGTGSEASKENSRRLSLEVEAFMGEESGVSISCPECTLRLRRDKRKSELAFCSTNAASEECETEFGFEKYPVAVSKPIRKKHIPGNCRLIRCDICDYESKDPKKKKRNLKEINPEPMPKRAKRICRTSAKTRATNPDLKTNSVPMSTTQKRKCQTSKMTGTTSKDLKNHSRRVPKQPKTEIPEHAGSSFEESGKTEATVKAKNLVVKSNKRITVKENQPITVKGNRPITVKGNQRITTEKNGKQKFAAGTEFADFLSNFQIPSAVEKSQADDGVCDVCGDQFDTRDELLLHNWMEHTGEHSGIQVEADTKESKADLRKYVEKNIEIGQAHDVNLSKVKLENHIVDITNKEFAHVRALKGKTWKTQYRYRKTQLLEYPLRCEMCNFKTNTRSHMTEHIQGMHPEVLPNGRRFKCRKCEKAFVRTGDLTNHMVTHTRKVVAQCEVCYKTFWRVFHYARHMKLHSNIRDIICHLCGYATHNKDNLKKHWKNKKH